MPLDNRGIATIIGRRQNREILAGIEPGNRFISEQIAFDTLSVFPPSEDSAARSVATHGEEEEEVGGNGGWREKVEQMVAEGKNTLWRVGQCLS